MEAANAGGQPARRLFAGRARTGAGLALHRPQKNAPVIFSRKSNALTRRSRVALWDLINVGRLLTASHRSSQTRFENSTPELDFLVDHSIALPAVYGARLTGGGFGGAVMALTSPEFGDGDARRVADAYQKRFGARPDILHTAADGRRRRVDFAIATSAGLIEARQPMTRTQLLAARRLLCALQVHIRDTVIAARVRQAVIRARRRRDDGRYNLPHRPPE